jgi:hypothetical protein
VTSWWCWKGFMTMWHITYDTNGLWARFGVFSDTHWPDYFKKFDVVLAIWYTSSKGLYSRSPCTTRRERSRLFLHHANPRVRIALYCSRAYAYSSLKSDHSAIAGTQCRYPILVRHGRDRKLRLKFPANPANDKTCLYRCDTWLLMHSKNHRGCERHSGSAESQTETMVPNERCAINHGASVSFVPPLPRRVLQLLLARRFAYNSRYRQHSGSGVTH